MKKILFLSIIFLSFFFLFNLTYPSEIDNPFYTKKFNVAKDINGDLLLRTSFYKFDKSINNYAIFMIRKDGVWDKPLFGGNISKQEKEYLNRIFKEKYKPILDNVVYKHGALIISIWPVTNEIVIYFDEKFEKDEKFHEEMKNKINEQI